MTKKNYEAIASKLLWHDKNLRQQEAWEKHNYFMQICHDLADYFEQDNPRFKRDRFLAACGIESQN